MIPETDKTILGSLSRAARGGTLDPERLAHRAYEMGSANCHKAISRSLALPETLNLNDLEKAALEKALQVTRRSIPAAAQLLGVGKPPRIARQSNTDSPPAPVPPSARTAGAGYPVTTQSAAKKYRLA
jgi:hypothetical protein